MRRAIIDGNYSTCEPDAVKFVLKSQSDEHTEAVLRKQQDSRRNRAEPLRQALARYTSYVVAHYVALRAKAAPTKSMQMILEQWPGGRWFRDRGNGIGHLWGHVQVIKPPVLLELSGPMFMSYPALNHVELRLDQIAGGTKVTLRHRAIGLLDSTHREIVGTGWRHYLDSIGKDFADGVAAHRA